MAFVITSNELLNDVPMLDAHMKRVFAAEVGFKLDLAVLSGTGAGVPLGILNSPATIKVAKQTGQASGTIVAQNIQQMWTAMPAPSRRRAVWLVSEQAEEQLDNLTTVIGTAGVVPPSAAAMYMPAADEDSYPRLKGRPVIAIEQASTLGTVGDIVLADLSQYVLIDGGLNPAISVAVRFLTDETVWRFRLRVDGSPAWVSPVTSYNGSGTRSPFVALAAR
jgi:HK97 family phage major capsid protein